MKLIYREIESVTIQISKSFPVIVITGPRQTGKTTLIEQILEPFMEETLFLNGDDADVREMFTNLNATQLIPIMEYEMLCSVIFLRCP